MTQVAREIQNYTREQVEQHVTDALSIALDPDVPNDLAAVVFQVAFTALSAKRIEVTQLGGAIALGPNGRAV